MTMAGAAEAAVLYEKIGDHVAQLTLNRPEARNAINSAMAESIEGFVHRAENDPAIRAVIFAAAGTSFCAGADLKEVAAGRGAELSRPGTGFAGFVFGKRKKPWIAAVQGAAHGGGTEIALACDLIVAGEEASFGLTEARRGLIAGAGGCIRLARALPRAIAIEMVTTGVPISAARAYALGLANRLVPTDAVAAEARAIADAIAANSPLSVRLSLDLTRSAVDLLDEQLMALQDTAVAEVIGGPDLIEGAKAFVEKRAPRWQS